MLDSPESVCAGQVGLNIRLLPYPLVCALIAFSYVLSSRPPLRCLAHQPCSPWWCGCPWSLGPSRGPSAGCQQPGWP
jgi:hypothetical protein